MARAFDDIPVPCVARRNKGMGYCSCQLPGEAPAVNAGHRRKNDSDMELTNGSESFQCDFGSIGPAQGTSLTPWTGKL